MADKKNFVLRIDGDVYKLLEKWAADDFRSVNGQIEWIINQQHTITYTRFFDHDSLPLHTSYDVLIVMGGPMGVHDEQQYTWLVQEKSFIAEAISLNKKILGVCLGSQLLACVLKANVYANKEKEIGFFPIIKNNDQSGFFHHFPETAIVFHWHGDTFDLPANATLLASSEACINQAFSVGNSIVGLQFHLEVTEQIITGLLQHGMHEIVDAPYIQNPNEIISGYKHLQTCNNLLIRLLNNLLNIK